MTSLNVSGMGEVLKLGVHVCSVKYTLRQSDLPSGEILLMGAVRLAQTDTLSPSDLKSLVSGELYTLRLEDGRLMEVWFDQFDPPGSGLLWVLFTSGNSPLG